jgi:hypothetical protein
MKKVRLRMNPCFNSIVDTRTAEGYVETTSQWTGFLDLETSRSSFLKLVAGFGSRGQWIMGSGTSAASANQRDTLSGRRSIRVSEELTIPAHAVRKAASYETTWYW